MNYPIWFTENQPGSPWQRSIDEPLDSNGWTVEQICGLGESYDAICRLVSSPRPTEDIERLYCHFTVSGNIDKMAMTWRVDIIGTCYEKLGVKRARELGAGHLDNFEKTYHAYIHLVKTACLLEEYLK